MKKAWIVFTISMEMYKEMGTMFWKAMRQDLHNTYKLQRDSFNKRLYVRKGDHGIQHVRRTWIRTFFK